MVHHVLYCHTIESTSLKFRHVLGRAFCQIQLAALHQNPRDTANQRLGHRIPNVLAVRVHPVPVRLVYQGVAMNNYQSIRSVGSKDIAQRRTINGELVEARLFSWEVMNLPSPWNHDRIIRRTKILKRPLTVGPIPMIFLGYLRLGARRKPVHDCRRILSCCRHSASQCDEDNKHLPKLHRHLTSLLLYQQAPEPIGSECTA